MLCDRRHRADKALQIAANIAKLPEAFAFLALTPPAEYADGLTGELAYWRNVRFGSKADIARDQLNVRFTLKSGHGSARS